MKNLQLWGLLIQQFVEEATLSLLGFAYARLRVWIFVVQASWGC